MCYLNLLFIAIMLLISKDNGILAKVSEWYFNNSLNCVHIDITKSVILPSLQFEQNLARIQSSNAFGSVLAGDAASLPGTRINHWMNTNWRELRIPFSTRMSSSSAHGAYRFRIESVSFACAIAPLPGFSRFHETGAFACRKGTTPSDERGWRVHRIQSQWVAHVRPSASVLICDRASVNFSSRTNVVAITSFSVPIIAIVRKICSILYEPVQYHILRPRRFDR